MDYGLLALVIVVAVGINLPFGAWRTTTRKFSVRWFLSIHLPIPAIFVIRRAAGFGWDYVPVMVACAVTGQLAGGWLATRLRRRPADAQPGSSRPSTSAAAAGGSPAILKAPLSSPAAAARVSRPRE